MTRLELIKLIGDVLTKLDVLRGSLLPTDPERPELDRLRKKLDGMQLKLVIARGGKLAAFARNQHELLAAN